MTGELIITKKCPSNQKYKTISIRMKKSLLEELNQISKKTGRSRTEIINLLLEEAIKRTEVID